MFLDGCTPLIIKQVSLDSVRLSFPTGTPFMTETHPTTDTHHSESPRVEVRPTARAVQTAIPDYPLEPATTPLDYTSTGSQREPAYDQESSGTGTALLPVGPFAGEQEVSVHQPMIGRPGSNPHVPAGPFAAGQDVSVFTSILAHDQGYRPAAQLDRGTENEAVLLEETGTGPHSPETAVARASLAQAGVNEGLGLTGGRFEALSSSPYYVSGVECAQGEDINRNGSTPFYSAGVVGVPPPTASSRTSSSTAAPGSFGDLVAHSPAEAADLPHKGMVPKEEELEAMNRESSSPYYVSGVAAARPQKEEGAAAVPLRSVGEHEDVEEQDPDSVVGLGGLVAAQPLERSESPAKTGAGPLSDGGGVSSTQMKSATGEAGVVPSSGPATGVAAGAAAAVAGAAAAAATALGLASMRGGSSHKAEEGGNPEAHDLGRTVAGAPAEPAAHSVKTILGGEDDEAVREEMADSEPTPPRMFATNEEAVEGLVGKFEEFAADEPSSPYAEVLEPLVEPEPMVAQSVSWVRRNPLTAGLLAASPAVFWFGMWWIAGL